MEIRSRIHNGVVVLEGELPLPEGTEVIVSSRGGARNKAGREATDRVPSCPVQAPGSLQLTDR